MGERKRRKQRLEDELSNAYREADKILVAVSSGVIAVSVALIGNIAEPVQTWSIRASWIFMIVTVLTVLLSLVTERADRIFRLDRLHRKKKEKENCYTALSRFLNNVSTSTFIFGLTALAWFLWANTNNWGVN